ncbi:MAG TPA: hypothetical protein VFS34_02540 [Thermoanaerobaculia bacterium]|nr:hypothetical protein [Thermoanaerobaculia bacterium]
MTRGPAAVSPRKPDPADVPDYTARWSAFSLALDEKTLTTVARQAAESIPELDDLTVHVSPGELSVTVVVRRFGVPLSARASLSQIRFKDGFLAFVVESVDALSFIPIPDALIGLLIEKAPAGLLTYYKADRILVVNVNEWIPTGLDVALDRAEFGRGEVTFFLTPGRFDLSRILEKRP